MVEKTTATHEALRGRNGLKAIMLVAVLIVFAFTAAVVMDSDSSDAADFKLSFSPESLKVDPNSSGYVTASFTGEYTGTATMTMTSSDTSVATVDSSVTVSDHSADIDVTSKKAGTANITVTLKIDNVQKDQKRFTVTVKKDVTNVKIVNSDKSVIPNNKLNLNTYDEKTVIAVVTPDDATEKGVTWKTSDDTKVSVDNGKLVAKAPGSATITATSIDNSSIKATITVEVKNIDVTGVTLEPATGTVKIGSDITLKATISPANATIKTIEVTIGDKEKLRIKSQTPDPQKPNEITIVLTAIGEQSGDVNVTVKTTDKGKEATSKITVQRVAVTGVELTEESVELEVHETHDLTAKVKPDNATVKTVSWTSSNINVATIDSNGKVTAKSPGTSTITVKTTEGDFTDTCVITVLKTFTITASVDQDATTGKGQVQNVTKAIEDIKSAAANNLYPVFYIKVDKCKSVFMTPDLIQTLQRATEGSMQIEYAIGYMAFDNAALKKIDTSGEKVGIGLSQLDSTAYSKFGACYVYEMTMYKNDTAISTTFGGTGPKLAIIHTPISGEDVTKLQVAYVYGEDKAILMREYEFVTDKTVTPEQSAVVFELAKTAKFLYMFHDSEYVKKGDYDMLFVILFGALVVLLGGGIGFLVFNPKASAVFFGVFEKRGDRPPRKPRKPRNQDQFDNFGGNNYY